MRPQAEALVALLRMRGPYTWQHRDSLQEAMGWTRQQISSVLRFLMWENRVERQTLQPKYRLNNARRVEAEK